MDKTITVTVDDEQRTIHTFAPTVAGALQAAGLRVGDQDTLAPTAGSVLENGSRIVLKRARPLALTVDGMQHEVWTTALTVKNALAQVGIQSRDTELSADPSQRIPVDGMALVVRTTKPITLFDGGLPAKEVHSTALSVDDLLTQQGVPLQAQDTVTPERTSPVLPGMTVQVTRVRIEERNEKRLVLPPVRKLQDPEMPVGSEVVEDVGAPGEQIVTFRLTLANGKEIARKQISIQQVAPVRPTMVRVGAKEPAASEGTVWDHLARCESGGNWAANSGNGYYGGLQFDKTTWSANGGDQFAPYPYQASREQQIAVAERVRNARGNYHAWPTCSVRVGLA
ncbi:MAG: transglycosylase family protein [Pseudonocardiales bacterium]|nr:transglycosylase family protein [Pseudonocardiales bacterium]MBV9164513.1 transglycosylase family protein [Pseudonocardiales bacterium]